MKMILIECCDKCPYFGEGVCSETMKHNPHWNQIADFCPKQDAPQLGVTITDETYRPEDGTSLDAVTDALSFNQISAWVEEIKP